MNIHDWISHRFAQRRPYNLHYYSAIVLINRYTVNMFIQFSENTHQIAYRLEILALWASLNN